MRTVTLTCPIPGVPAVTSTIYETLDDSSVALPTKAYLEREATEQLLAAGHVTPSQLPLKFTITYSS